MYDLGIVVPARRGSSRIAEKCALPFGGEDTLIAWKLKQLKQVIPAERIYLSSEDDGFLEIARGLDVSRHKRPVHLATDHIAPFRDVITGIVQDIPHAHVAWCTVVCPLMSPRDYCGAFHAYAREVIDGEYDSLVGVTPAKEYLWSAEAPLNYEASRNHTISQELPDWYRVSNSIYMCRKDLILQREYFLGERPFLEQLPKLSAIDIDVIEDYHIAAALHAVYAANGLERLPRQDRIDWSLARAA